MDRYPKTIEDLVHSLSALPGIGRRTAERLAIALLDWDPAHLHHLGGLIATLVDRVRPCDACGNFAETALCRICTNANRDTNQLCIVETARQIPVIENCGRFFGLYHVLGGRLSPLDSVDVANLSITSLYDRVAALNISEVIISTSPDVEGEATATYLASELNERFDIVVTRIALGVPLGSDLTFADAATMGLAIDSRRKVH